MSAKEIGRSPKKNVTNLIIRLLLGICFCILFCWVILCILAKVLCMMDISESWLVPLTTCGSAAAIMLGALIHTTKIGSNGAIWGGALSIGCWIIICLGGIAQGNGISQLILLKLLAFICAGMTGGILGVALFEKRKKKIRR